MSLVEKARVFKNSILEAIEPDYSAPLFAVLQKKKGKAITSEELLDFFDYLYKSAKENIPGDIRLGLAIIGDFERADFMLGTHDLEKTMIEEKVKAAFSSPFSEEFRLIMDGEESRVELDYSPSNSDKLFLTSFKAPKMTKSLVSFLPYERRIGFHFDTVKPEKIPMKGVVFYGSVKDRAPQAISA